MNGVATEAYGTSLTTPIFAAGREEIDQHPGTRKGNVVGTLYTLFRRYGYGSFPGGGNVFRDIAQEHNEFPTDSGYDWVSRLGSVNLWALSAVE